MSKEIKDKIRDIIKELVNYRFKDEYRFESSVSDLHSLMKDANALECPVMIIAPEECPEDDDGELRVWVYGGCIATISTRTGKVEVKPHKNISDSQRKRNTELCKYVKESPGRETTPYDYGKYLYDGFIDGNGNGYRLSRGMKAKYASKDRLGAYKAYESLVSEHKNDGIKEELLDLMTYAAYTRWLCREEGSDTPRYAGEKMIQCAIAKKSMANDKYAPEERSAVIVDIEYHFLGEKKSRADFVIFDGKSFGLVEFKYLGKSMDNLTKHLEDFNKVLRDKSKGEDIIDELIRKTGILCRYGVLDSSWERAIRSFKENEKKHTSGKHLWCGFYFLGDGKDIGMSGSQYDVTKQINKHINKRKAPDASAPVRYKITALKEYDMNDPLSAGWKYIRE